MALYQERADFFEAYMGASRESKIELIGIEIRNIQEQIRYTQQEIAELGISWFGEKRQKKRQLKAELKHLHLKLSLLQKMRNGDNLLTFF